MSNDRPKSGRARFLEALEVRKNAVRGFGIGTVFTVLVYVVFVVLPGGSFETGLWYLGLALSLALTLGGLLTVILLAVQARRLVRDL